MPAPTISNFFGAEVRSQRLRQKLSQESLAELAQVHPTYISMVERGVKNPTLEVADRLAKALKIPLSKLVECAESARESK